jgi:hypothetical protein
MCPYGVRPNAVCCDRTLPGAKDHISASSASAREPPHPLHLIAQMSHTRVQAGQTTSNVSSSSASKAVFAHVLPATLPSCLEDSLSLPLLAVSSWSNLEAAAATSHSNPPLPTAPRDGGGGFAAFVPPSNRSCLTGGARRVAWRSRFNDSNDGITVRT